MTTRPNTLRIIGGEWRGRKLRFPPLAGIRPTPDRVRETLFNWLRDDIVGAHCLDLFAGSGALGLEALSRGAAHVVFVDSEVGVKRHLTETLKQLGSTAAQIHIGDALRIALTPSRPFDVVFLDPPYDRHLVGPIADRLESSSWLAPNALIYFECPAHDAPPTLPARWRVLKNKSAGQVGYHLARRQS